MRFFAALLLVLSFGAIAQGDDFGLKTDKRLKRKSLEFFGIEKPLDSSAPATSGPYRTLTQTAAEQVSLAPGLKVRYLTRNAAERSDMMAFFPAIGSTHLITCVESTRTIIDGVSKLNPSVQRINLSTGSVETILRGMDHCDGIRTTPWGTILATEETFDGGAYEILNPLTTTEQSVTDRATGMTTNSSLVAKRTAMATVAWEGLTVLLTGVVIGGDELRPGNPADADGGSIFKFVPATPHSGGNIGTLSDSPLVSGTVHAMQASCITGVQYGQGCEVGQGTWIPVNAATARTDANNNGATGYNRPEDLHVDPLFVDPSFPNAVRLCWSNTGNAAASHFAEIMCAMDRDPLIPGSTVIVNRFLEGDGQFNSFDNLDFQPKSGILYVLEDTVNGDIWACLRDGADRDIKSDGCIRIASIKDSSAEPTGFIFSADGKTAYLSIQHSDDTNMPPVDGYSTDDILVITGFQDPLP